MKVYITGTYKLCIILTGTKNDWSVTFSIYQPLWLAAQKVNVVSRMQTSPRQEVSIPHTGAPITVPEA